MADSNNTQKVFTALLESKKPAKKVTKSRKAENNLRRRKVENEEEIMTDVIDNIQVVTDPEKSVDDLEVIADKIQDIIESTPEGEVAFSDEYVGDNVYACPICGEKFFADETYQEGDVCPICKAEPTEGFLSFGVVTATDDITDDEVMDIDTLETDDEIDTGIDDVEDVEEVEDDEDVEEVEEGYKARRAKREAIRRQMSRKRKAEARARSRRRVVRENDAPVFNVDIDIATKTKEEEGDEFELAPEVVDIPTEPECLDCEIDEESFDEALTEFVTENYGSSCRRMRLKKAKYNESTDTLKLECVIVTKQGKRVPVTLALKEAKSNGKRAVLRGFETSKALKIESKQAPFAFKVSRVGKKLKCESLTYSYITTHNKVGKVKVEGLAKGKKSSRKVESRKFSKRTLKEGLFDKVEKAISNGVKKEIKHLDDMGYSIDPKDPTNSFARNMGTDLHDLVDTVVYEFEQHDGYNSDDVEGVDFTTRSEKGSGMVITLKLKGGEKVSYDVVTAHGRTYADRIK